MDRVLKSAGLLSLIFWLFPGSVFAAYDPSVNLTRTERQWLAKHPHLVVGLSNAFPPFEFVDESGAHVGIAVDYLKLVAKKLGIQFNAVFLANQEEVWKELLAGKIDVIGAVSPPLEPLQEVRFTKPYFEIPAVLIVREALSGSLTLQDLAGKKVAVGRGSPLQEYLTRNHPGISLEVVPDIPTALYRVSFGEADAMVENLASASHFIEQSKITNLRVAGDSGHVFQLSIGVRHDFPQLASILDKGLRAIRSPEKQAISRKWISFKKATWQPDREFVITVLFGLLGLMGMFAMVWNRTLQKKVDLRTYELKKELRQRERIESQLREKMERDRLLDRISRGFLDGEYEPAVEEALAAIGTHLNTDGAFVFIYDDHRTTACCAHDWRRKGVPPFPPEWVHLSVSALQQMHDVLASGSFWSVENVSDLPPTDGDLRGVLERGSIRSLIHVPMGYRGQVIGYTGLLSVTDPFPWTDREVEILHSLGELVAMSRARSQAEIDIRRAKEISETASQAKSRFLSSMSHELRTPLNGILGFADLLRGQYFGPLNEKQANFIQQIDDAGKHLLSLINDLLDIAKIDSGQMHLDTEEVDVAEAVQSVLSIMTPQFVKKSIRVESRIAPPGAMLIADLRKLKQILFNLLSNAAKYTPDGGTIEVWSEIGQGPSMTLFVRDSGIGIKPDELHKIFSEFYQADKIRDNQLGGTGIGLSLTRRLTELHGGQIGVESELGKGSTFWVRFPPSRVSIPRKAGVRSPLDAEAEPEGGATFSGYRILLVEDNEVNVSMMLDMLSIQGFEVVVARNGLEAVQQARERKMDLILMDMKMPVMNGLEATNLLRSMPKYAQTPIIALTASTGSEAEERQMRIGCTEHLAKPIQIQKLFEVLKKYLGNEIPTSNPEA